MIPQRLYLPADSDMARAIAQVTWQLDPALPLEVITLSREDWEFRKRFLHIGYMLPRVRPATAEKVRAMAVTAVPAWMREKVITDFLGAIEGIACEAPHSFLREALRVTMADYGPTVKAELATFRKRAKAERNPARRRQLTAMLMAMRRGVHTLRNLY